MARRSRRRSVRVQSVTVPRDAGETRLFVLPEHWDPYVFWKRYDLRWATMNSNSPVDNRDMLRRDLENG